MPLIIFVELNFKHVVHQAIFEFIVGDPTTRLNVGAFVDFVVDALAQNTLAERDQGQTMLCGSFTLEIAEGSLRYLHVSFDEVGGQSWFKLVEVAFHDDFVATWLEKLC